MKKKILITGMGVVSPIGKDLESFWTSLKEGRHGFGPITRFDAKEFSCQIAAEMKQFNPAEFLSKKKIKHTDLFTQYVLAAARMAVQDAHLNFPVSNPHRMGVIVGTGSGGVKTYDNLIKDGLTTVSPFTLPMLVPNAAAAEIAIEYGCQGPNYCVSSACASSSHALGDAYHNLLLGKADIMIGGGTEAAINASGIMGFSRCRAMTTKFNADPAHASRPFDANRAGFVMGEGAGVLILETEEHALARGAQIYGEFAGFAATSDAYHITAPNPAGTSVIRAMKLAMEEAGVKPAEVDYINAHGTSTPLNDAIETQAIKAVFGSRSKEIPISSTKSMMGHLLGGAGVVELIATLLCLKNEKVHPTINYETPDPNCDLDYVPNKARDKKIKVAVSNSFGFGGHNAVIVVKKWK